MIKRLLLLVSTICTLLVVASFVMFSLDQANAGSKTQQAAAQFVDQPDPSAAAERARERDHSKVREWVDDANDVLTKPFDGIVNSSNIWVQRSIPALLAVLLYFVVLRILAGYAVKLRV